MAELELRNGWAYRGIYERLLDGKDFLALSANGRLCLFVLKLSLGPLGIAPLPGGVATLAERAGLSYTAARSAADELGRKNWLRREGNLWWLVDGLEYEPLLRLGDWKHRQGVQKRWELLPNLGLREAFRERYRQWWEPLAGGSEGAGEGLPSPSEGAGDNRDRDGDGDRNKDESHSRPPGGAALERWRKLEADIAAAWNPLGPTARSHVLQLAWAQPRPSLWLAMARGFCPEGANALPGLTWTGVERALLAYGASKFTGAPGQRLWLSFLRDQLEQPSAAGGKAGSGRKFKRARAEP